MATDPWAGFEEVTAPVAPSYPGVIPGRPKVAPAPTAIQLENVDMQRERLRLAQEAAARAAAKDAEGTESERTAGFLTNRLVEGVSRLSQAVKVDPTAVQPTLGVESVRNVFGNTAANYFTDPQRQQVRAAQMDVLDAALTLGTGAAYTQEQLEGYRESYFPSLGDDETTVASKREALRALILSAQVKAGKAAPDIDKALAAIDSLAEVPVDRLANEAANDEGLTGAPISYEGPNPANFASPAPPPPAETFLGSVGDLVEGAGALPGIVINPVGQALYDATGYGDQTYDFGKIVREGLGLPRNPDGLLRSVNTFGASAMTGGMAARAAAPLAAPSSVTGSVLNTLGRTPIRDTVVGVGAGAGSYYGEKVGGPVGALAGAVAGGIGGYTGAGALAGLGAPRQVNTAVAALRDAGQAEGVTINRALADPRSANRVSGVDATALGGARLQRGMRKIEGQIEGRVQALGRDGRPLLNSMGEPDNIALGDTIKRAGERSIERTGRIAKRKYDRAERLAGDAKVTPQQSLSRVEAMITKLGETPETNAEELRFLEKIRSDLSNDLSVGGLRRMRTSLRKKISKGDLVYGEDEANVLAIMDGAADDIRTGLAAQGKEEAAAAFDAADKSYRARMEYITGTVQNLLGKRHANLSAEDIAKKFTSLTSKDARGLRKFYATLEPEEAADVAATFAERLGTNAKDGFTVAQFMRQTGSKNMSEEALRTMFGPEGVQSIKNLRTIGREVERVTGAMNSRTSKTAVANDYRSWLTNLVFGGGGAAALQGAASGVDMATLGTAAVGGAATLGVKATRDVLGARALMSPKITKWLTQAPRTSDPKAINAHFDRLAAIAKNEPALASEIKSLQENIMRAANDNVARSGAAVASPDQGPNEK